MKPPRSADPELRAPPVEAEAASVYVHFPYCMVKCPYCDFNSHAVAHDDVAYADAILAELEQRKHQLPVPPEGLASVYFGGGTPSRWDPGQVGRVIDALRRALGFRDGVELTLEANPGTVVEGRLEAFAAAGINRFSIGCQSFIDSELAELGRAHDAAAARRAVREAKSTGARVSLDLIYGLPGQDEPRARASVDTALELEPDHLSAYTLTIEPNTVLDRRTRLGLFRPMPDDDQARLIEAVTGHLARDGYARYEVSSYARAGKVSVHNTGYWLGAWYLGLGAGAHSCLPEGEGAGRRENVRAPSKYVESALAGAVTVPQFEQRDRVGLATDRLMVVFRTAFGLDVEAFFRTCPELDRAPVLAACQDLEARGFIEARDGRFRPTHRGFLFNDAVAVRMLEAADAWQSTR